MLYYVHNKKALVYEVQRTPHTLCKADPLHNGKPPSASLLYHIFILFSRGELHFPQVDSRESKATNALCFSSYVHFSVQGDADRLARFFVKNFQGKGGLLETPLCTAQRKCCFTNFNVQGLPAGICENKFQMLFLIKIPSESTLRRYHLYFLFTVLRLHEACPPYLYVPTANPHQYVRNVRKPPFVYKWDGANPAFQ